jgi:multiple sugar transport system permease protein
MTALGTPTRSRGRLGRVVRRTTLGLVLVIFLLPFLWMLLGSFRPNAEIISSVQPFGWRTFWPDNWTLANYQDVLGLSETGRTLGFRAGRNLFNSTFVSVMVVGLSLFTSTIAAYVFSRIRFPGREIVFWVFLGTMFIPWQATIVPLYLVVDRLGLANSYAGLIAPWFASPFVVFMMRQFFNSIPRELDEAAICDGAGHLTILFRILLPNALPALVTVGLLELQNIWNEFYWPLVSVSSNDLQVIQVALLQQAGSSTQFWGRLFAMSVLAAVPVVLVFLIFQRFYVRGLVNSGIK